ncbi:hypothetical protein [Colwellia piezophila]|uniref:hypothetical protein n=1 Tax=Colwellia piezophila TaxID=211668 RepID=UPI00037B4D3E|nr:hypothetical protein [Colwellia piezophila]
MVSPIDGNSSVSQVLQQQHQQVAEQQALQRDKDNQQEINRQTQERAQAAQTNNDPDSRIGRSVDISV